jgi:hypothetical protein
MVSLQYNFYRSSCMLVYGSYNKCVRYLPSFKYIPIHTLVFEKMWADDVVCSSLSSAKPDYIFWNKLEKTLFRWLIGTTFIQIVSHPLHSFWTNRVQMMSSAQVWGWKHRSTYNLNTSLWFCQKKQHISQNVKHFFQLTNTAILNDGKFMFQILFPEKTASFEN